MWYYANDGKQLGPVTESDLETLYRDGIVNTETLVWREGMANWAPYHEAKPTPVSPAVVAGPPVLAATDGVICAECGRTFPASEVLQYGAAHVCAACKPLFVQKLKEGASVGALHEYAGIGARFGAKLLDGIILQVVGAVIAVLIGHLMGGPAGGRRAGQIFTAAQGMQMGANMLISMLYSCYFLGAFGATPGKMACKIKVVRPDGSRIGYGRAAARPLAELVSGLILGIGYFMALWDDQRRTLHDRICDTRVVKK